MDSVTSKIKQQILNLERGSIFFPDDFVDLGTPEAIRQTLTRFCKEGLIIRIAQGIYCYPEIEEKLGLGILQPSFEHIAEAMAQRDHARIVPTGAYALNILGLSTQVPMNYVYLTDGSKRHVQISNGRGITFTLKSLKKENIEDWHIKRIRELLQNEQKESVMADFKLIPVWIRNIIKQAYE